MPYADFQDYAKRQTSFRALAAFTPPVVMAFRGTAGPERIFGEFVSKDYFGTLGIRPAAGRFFLPEEDSQPGSAPVAVLSYNAWQLRFGGAPDVIGRLLVLNNVGFTVIGVAPQRFLGVSAVFGPDVLASGHHGRERVSRGLAGALSDRAKGLFHGVGRLRPGSTREQAQADLLLRHAIQEAAIRGVGKAAEVIDLTKHQGAHPRMGAADVIPFIPIDGVSIEDCVAMARQVGAEIAKRFQIPVYLYEAAAATPERQNLENIRRGQFEGIRDEIATNPARKPDFGEARVHPTAGATVVGARKALIAYNVFLNTADVDIAKKIAKAVRFSSGGLRFVKGAGFLVRGLAQVSMNLTDFEQTPIHRVFEFVKREAARYGVIPVSSEIVGLIPKLALEQAAEWFLQVENFDSSLILENRLAAGHERQDGRGRSARRSRALHRTISRSDRDSRRRQRRGCRGSHGCRARVHGSVHVARQESLSAI